MVSDRGFAASAGWRRSLEIGTGIALGILGVTVILASLARRGPLIPAMVIAAVPVIVAVVLRPRYGVILLIFSMAFIEEFRGGIGDTKAGGDEFLRSERTPFYSATLGLPGLYAPDVLVLGTLLLFLVKGLLLRSELSFRFDKIGVGLLVLAFAVLLSLVASLASPDPFGEMILDMSTLGSVKLPEKNVTDVARYIPLLQYKLFLIVFPSYVLGLAYFREERDVELAINVVGLAMLATIVLAVVRLVRDPGMIKALTPVIFDTGTVALMAMTVFYTLGRWTSNHYPPTRAIFKALLCTLMIVLILLSFRRTMWGAMALAFLLFPFILPRHALSRLLAIIGIGMALGLVLAVATPPGQALLQSVISRAGETNLNQASTLYRFAIAVWLVERGQDIPLFGYGFAPLWNEKVYVRFFFTSMENVHSLYLWILLRLGIVGFLASILATGLVIFRIIEVLRRTRDERYGILVGVILLSVLMYLFNGIFNPVYANVRHLVPLGLSLALVTQLPGILARRNEKTVAV